MADNCAKGRRQHKFTTVQQLMTTAFQALFTFASSVSTQQHSFGALGFLQVSSPAVLLCKTVCNQLLLNLPYYCINILSLPRFQQSRGERLNCPRGSDGFELLSKLSDWTIATVLAFTTRLCLASSVVHLHTKCQWRCECSTDGDSFVVCVVVVGRTALPADDGWRVFMQYGSLPAAAAMPSCWQQLCVLPDSADAYHHRTIHSNVTLVSSLNKTTTLCNDAG